MRIPETRLRLPRLLVADDEFGIRQSLELIFKQTHEVVTAASGAEVLVQLDARETDVVLLDIRMPGMDGMATLQQIRAKQPEVVVIMLTAITNVETVVEAMRLGAHDYVTKPFDMHRIRLVLERALERRDLQREVHRLRAERSDFLGTEPIIGRSTAMQAVLNTVRQVADRNTTVLIHGESGTGKELVARAIHHSGTRADEPLIVVNCAAIPEALLESQLFGHEKGAFTDAHDRRIGQFVQAGQGTVFLDEIGEMPLAMQAKVLRVLQEREVLPVGGTRPIPVAARIIAATNKDLDLAIQAHEFRSDLYYRINVVPIHLPPLRERCDDIPFLVERFLSDFDPSRKLEFARGVLETLVAYRWPGNVRELQNVIERMVALAPSNVISIDLLPQSLRKAGRIERLQAAVLDGELSFRLAVETLESTLISKALRRTAGEQTSAAELLGITRRMLKYKMDKYGLSPTGDMDDSQY